MKKSEQINNNQKAEIVGAALQGKEAAQRETAC